GVYRIHAREGKRRGLGFCESAILDIGASGGGNHGSGNGLFNVCNSPVRFEWQQGRRMATSHPTESDHFSVPIFCGVGRAGDGDSELFSCVWIAGSDTDLSKSSDDFVLGCGGVEVFQESRNSVSGGGSCRGCAAIFDTGAFASPERNDVQIWGFVYASRDSQCSEADDPAAFWNSNWADQPAGGHAASDGLPDAGREL